MSTLTAGEPTLTKRPSTSDLTSDSPDKKPRRTSFSLNSDTVPLQIKRLTETAKLPLRGSAHAAGWDLFASAPSVIPARGRKLIDTGIAMAIPAGCYGRVAPRSGLAVKKGVETGAGVIDSDYRGEVKVLLFNHSDEEFKVEAGDRIAQLILERIYVPELVEVEQLDETVRGAGGFGSTGHA